MFVSLQHKQLHVTTSVTLRFALQHKRHKTKRLTISFPVPVHAKKQVADLRANLSLTNISLFDNTITHTQSTKQFLYTNRQSNTVQPHRNSAQGFTEPNNWLLPVRVICFSTGGCTGPPTYGKQIPPTRRRRRPWCLHNTGSY
jgi:hypothetical protein